MPRVWGIKLGSGGRLVAFCEGHGIVGLGWQNANPHILRKGTIGEIVSHLQEVYPERAAGRDAGSLWRFYRECETGDLILYYVPATARFCISRVEGEACHRDVQNLADLEALDTEGAPVDIWQYREVKILREFNRADPPLGFAPFEYQVLGPRIAFWAIRQPAEQDGQGDEAFEILNTIAEGRNPLADDTANIRVAAAHLSALIVNRAKQAFNWREWQDVVADFMAAQNGITSPDQVGANPAWDVEARFDRDVLGSEVWRVSVKCERNGVGDATLSDLAARGGNARLAAFSVYGFTEQARRFADANEIAVWDADDLAHFLVSGRLRHALKAKLGLIEG